MTLKEKCELRKQKLRAQYGNTSEVLFNKETMTPKEKAKELFMDMKYHIPYVHDPTEPSEDKIAKECAL